jgi:hypothetical protein
MNPKEIEIRTEVIWLRIGATGMNLLVPLSAQMRKCRASQGGLRSTVLVT